jgi:two-component system, OmpR family, phosphate regulon sensor histidine kinase PhoR
LRFHFRLTVFFTAFGGAVLAFAFVLMTVAPVAVGEVRTRLFTVTILGIGGALVAAFVVASALAAPLEQRVNAILEVVRRYSVGDLRRAAPDYGDDEIGEMARAMDAAIQTLGQRIDELSRDRTRMVAILSSMVEGVLVVDEHGRLQHVNEAARRMLRMDHDLANRTYVEAIRHPGIVEEINAVLAGQQSQGLEFSLIRDVNRIFVARVAPVVSVGRGVVVVLHDITDLRRADQIRRDFVANVSHELRTPLTAIKGYVEALLDDPDDIDTRDKFLEIIHRQTSRMERLVADLLRLARIDAGQEAIEFARCDVGELIADLVRDFEAAASEKQQTIRVNVHPDACAIVVDSAKLHDILRNLIENAVSYTPAGGTIDIETKLAGSRYQITVADNGPGIPPDDLSRVFERFYRVDKSRARPGGTGLGLAIVKNLVNVMQGDVIAANGETGGAIFTVKLPVREAPEG